MTHEINFSTAKYISVTKHFGKKRKTQHATCRRFAATGKTKTFVSRYFTTLSHTKHSWCCFSRFQRVQKSYLRIGYFLEFKMWYKLFWYWAIAGKQNLYKIPNLIAKANLVISFPFNSKFMFFFFRNNFAPHNAFILKGHKSSLTHLAIVSWTSRLITPHCHRSMGTSIPRTFHAQWKVENFLKEKKLIFRFQSW